MHLNRDVAQASAKSGEIPALSRNGGSVGETFTDESGRLIFVCETPVLEGRAVRGGNRLTSDSVTHSSFSRLYLEEDPHENDTSVKETRLCNYCSVTSYSERLWRQF